MEKRMVITISLLISLLIGIFLLAGIYAKTVITDNQITAQNFNMSGGRFNQEANVLSQVGIITDEEGILKGIRGVYVQGKYAYVVSNNNDSLCIFDVYNPSNISKISCIQDNSSGGKAHYLDAPSAIFVSGKYAYVLSEASNSFSIYDISDSTKIAEIGYIKYGEGATTLNYPNQVSGLVISGHYAYALSTGDNSLSVFDISDPTNITEVGYIQDDSNGGSAHVLEQPRQVVIQGKYAYVVSYNNDSLSIFDISDPSNITETGYIQDDSQGGNATAMDGSRGVYIMGDYAYVVSNNEYSITVIDISNKSNPRQINYIQSEEQNGTIPYFSRANLITGAGDYIYVTSNSHVSSYNDSLCVFDLSNPYNIKEVQCVLDSINDGTFSGVHNPKSIFLEGNKIYITSVTSDSLSIIEISGVETPSVKTGTLEATLIDVLGNLRILRDVYIGNGLNVAGTGLFSSGLSVMKSLELFGNFTINNHQGISGNYSNGNCWTAYSGGIIYKTNCTSA